MTGLTNYSAFNLLNWLTGQVPQPSLPSVFATLFTAVGTDAGTGFTEASGTGFARVQVAGALNAGGAFTTSSPNITLGATAPAWLLALGTGAGGNGCSVYSETANAFIGTVASISGTAVVLTANAAHASSGAADVLTFSAFGQPTGTAPSIISNNTAQINFPQAGGTGWGTALAWGLYDALSAGNLVTWDFLGGFNWLPFEMPTASGTVTAKANGFASNDPIVFTAEYGGTLPTLSTGVMTGYTVGFVGTPATDSFVPNTTSGPTTPFVSTSSGSGMVRKITEQPIAANITPQYPTNSFQISAA